MRNLKLYTSAKGLEMLKEAMKEELQKGEYTQDNKNIWMPHTEVEAIKQIDAEYQKRFYEEMWIRFNVDTDTVNEDIVDRNYLNW